MNAFGFMAFIYENNIFYKKVLLDSINRKSVLLLLFYDSFEVYKSFMLSVSSNKYGSSLNI